MHSVTEESSKSTAALHGVKSYTHTHTHIEIHCAVIFPVDCDVPEKIALNPEKVIYRVIQQIDEQTSRHTHHGLILFTDSEILQMMGMKYRHRL